MTINSSFDLRVVYTSQIHDLVAYLSHQKQTNMALVLKKASWWLNDEIIVNLKLRNQLELLEKTQISINLKTWKMTTRIYKLKLGKCTR